MLRVSGSLLLDRCRAVLSELSRRLFGFLVVGTHGGHEVAVQIKNIALLVEQELLLISLTLILVLAFCIVQLQALDLNTLQTKLLQLSVVVDVDRNVRLLQLLT